MDKKIPRILFAAPKSGSGKTMITCGMIEVFKRRKQAVAALKCGPDYIDPLFHQSVLGVASGNLDTFFTDEEMTRYLLWERAKEVDLTILEGVMGYYDGMGGQSERASTYEVAKVTKTPVILIVDGKGASVSLAAMIKGMCEYRTDSGIKAVLLNRVSAGYYERLKGLIERECGIRVLGYLPELDEIRLSSRHLGLLPPDRIKDWKGMVAGIADAIEKTVDVEALQAMAEEAVPLALITTPDLPCLPQPVRIAVARDEAFSFYYAENLALLSKMGAEPVFFSPLHATHLPEEIDGLLLGGGYPEQYAEALDTTVLKQEIRQAIADGLPCLAEGGGFLYLQDELEGMDGKQYHMAGVLPGRGYRTQGLKRFGYLEVTNRTPGVLGERGQTMKGHEFHYWDCTQNGEDCIAKKPDGSKEYPCMIHTASYAVGFAHLYYYSNPDMIYQFLLSASRFQAGREARQHWDRIAKPIDSLGWLEDSVVRIAGMVNSAQPYDLQKRALLIFCGDHGVVQEGVTQTGSEVTQIVGENFTKGCSSVNIMARSAKVDVYTVDMGMDTLIYPTKTYVQGAMIDRKIARGCHNIARESAMSMAQCRQAVTAGSDAVQELKRQGYHILATGEMGIGNTTPTSALAAILLDLTPSMVTGKGAGLSDAGLHRKCQTVELAVDRVKKLALHPLTQPMEILAEVGGYEIAAMAGAFLGGVKYHMPLIIDGAISAVAALVAARIDQRVPDYVIASHESEEVTGKLALQALGVEAILHGRMRLGEGSGAVAVLPILDMAMDIYTQMGSFSEYEIAPYIRYEEGE
ncbi:MAG: cobyrinate a,c-diamide synthase [Lachnospiraceae bacterium]